MVMLRHMVPPAPGRRPQHAFLGLAPRVRLPPSRWQASGSSKTRGVDAGTQAGETGSRGRASGRRFQRARPPVASRHNLEGGGAGRTPWGWAWNPALPRLCSGSSSPFHDTCASSPGCTEHLLQRQQREGAGRGRGAGLPPRGREVSAFVPSVPWAARHLYTLDFDARLHSVTSQRWASPKPTHFLYLQNGNNARKAGCVGAGEKGGASSAGRLNKPQTDSNSKTSCLRIIALHCRCWNPPPRNHSLLVCVFKQLMHSTVGLNISFSIKSTCFYYLRFDL